MPSARSRRVVQSAAYLELAAFVGDTFDLATVEREYGDLIDDHVRRRTERLRGSIVTELRDDRSYPYPDETSDVLVEAERHAYDLLPVSSREAFSGGSRAQRTMNARLLQVALQERPDELDTIMSQVLDLTEEQRADLANQLRYSAVPSFVSASTEITHRLELIITLRHVLCDPDVAPEMREVDQLHPLVKEAVWLFGEHWRRAASEKSISTLSTLPDDRAVETDLSEGPHPLLPEDLRRRVDLVLRRIHHGIGDRRVSSSN